MISWDVVVGEGSYRKVSLSGRVRRTRYQSHLLSATTASGWYVVIREVKGENGPEKTRHSAQWHWLVVKGDQIKQGTESSLKLAREAAMKEAAWTA